MKKIDKSGVVSVIIIAVVMLTLLGLFTFALYKLGVITLPAFITDLIDGESETDISVIPGDEGKIYEALLNSKEDTDYGIIEYGLDADDVYDAVVSSSVCAEYSASFKLTLSESDKSREKTVNVIKSKEKYRIEIYEGGTLTNTIVCDGENVLIKNHVTFTQDSSYVYPATDNFSFDQQAGLPSIESIKDKDKITNLSVTLLRTSEDNLYYAEYDNREYGYSERLFISLEYGLVVRAESYDENGTFYTLECTELTAGLTEEQKASGDLFKAED